MRGVSRTSVGRRDRGAAERHPPRKEGYGGKPWVSLCSVGRRGPRRSRAPPPRKEGYGGKPWVSLCSVGRRGPRRSRAPPLCQFAVAMLVFLAGTARTRFVATDLLAGPCERLRLFKHRYVSFFLG